MVSSTVVVALGIAATIAVFVGIRWDASRSDVTRPQLWAAIAAVPIAIGLYLHLYVDAAPTTGVIMTANTGLVLYGFERELASEGDDPADPGWLPGDPTGGSESGDGDSEE